MLRDMLKVEKGSVEARVEGAGVAGESVEARKEGNDEAAEPVHGSEEHFLALANSPPDEHPEEEECTLCGGLFVDLDDMAKVVADALSEWEYNNFLLGNRLDPDMVEAEERLWEEVGTESQEPMKTELNREIGKRVEKIVGAGVEFKRPDIVAVLDVLYRHVEVGPNPVFFFGWYRKLERGIPQTRWPCRACGGRGCVKCDGTGKMYQTSVEELVCGPLMDRLEGDEHSFHGMGREDIDARMIGEGRPFVAEIKHPRKRKLDVEKAQEMINSSAVGRVEISGFRYSDKKEVRGIKDATPEKTYLGRVLFEHDISDEEMKKVMGLVGIEIAQRTPSRVSHRRADMVRKRKILELAYDRISPDTVDITIRAASGTYIKEFCHGDAGRTTPSIAELTGTPCSVSYLDVLKIHYAEE